ncbi:MAG: hydroxymethylglutaryl-CoA synthase [Proteobacteria bacterium]|nr:hydroxymethylglutaryl-CoA synthase [Pseudomonadota bacterium]
MESKQVGISSIGISFPSLVMSVEELAKLRNVDPEKFLTGLGCKQFSMCSEKENVITLATKAAERALSRWGGKREDIGLIAVGTESAVDMSRPLSAWVADELNLKGNIRSYEIKHACYGGTLALKQAVEWKMAGACNNKVALVIAADISLYAQNDPGEPTQGAGAIAMIIDDKNLIAEIDVISYPWSKPIFDFWRPVGTEFPLVQGEISLDAYKEAALFCHQELINRYGLKQHNDMFAYHCFHVPFPKMVKKAVQHIFKAYEWSDEQIDAYFKQRIEPTMEWNKLSGNSYTASLWIAVAKTLTLLEPKQRLTAFSYGSGCGAELLTLKAWDDVSKKGWADDVHQDFQSRIAIELQDYEKLRNKAGAYAHTARRE